MGYGAPFHAVASTRLAEVWLGWRTPFRNRTSFDEALTLSRSLQSGKFCLAVRAVDEAPAGPVDSALQDLFTHYDGMIRTAHREFRAQVPPRKRSTVYEEWFACQIEI